MALFGIWDDEDDELDARIKARLAKVTQISARITESDDSDYRSALDAAHKRGRLTGQRQSLAADAQDRRDAERGARAASLASGLSLSPVDPNGPRPARVRAMRTRISAPTNDAGAPMAPSTRVIRELQPDTPAPDSDALNDQLVQAGQGVLDIPRAAIGVASAARGGKFGQLMDRIGVRPEDWQKEMDSQLSPAYQRGQQAVSDAKGFGGTLKALAENPSQAFGAVARSLPAVAAGGVAGRLLSRATGISAVAGGAIGEGGQQFGGAIEDIRKPGGGLTAGEIGGAAVSGAWTTLVSLAGGRVAQRFGLADPDVMFAAAVKRPAVRVAFVKALKDELRKTAGAGLTEIGEETTQTIGQVISENLAKGKHPTEGMSESLAQAAVAAGLMGAGGQVLESGREIGDRRRGVEMPFVTPRAAPPQSPTLPAVLDPVTRPEAPSAPSLAAQAARREVDAMARAARPAPAQVPRTGIIPPPPAPPPGAFPVMSDPAPAERRASEVPQSLWDSTDASGRPLPTTEPALAMDEPPAYDASDPQIETPEFKAFFGDSKVVDGGGRPLLVHHGSPSKFTAFDKSKINQNDPDGPYNGFWFSSDERDARTSGEFPWGRPNAQDPQVGSYYISIKNPAPPAAINAARRAWRVEQPDTTLQTFVREALEKQGYDGIFHKPYEGTLDREAFARDGEVKVGRYTLRDAGENGVDLYQNGQHITGYESVDEAFEAIRHGTFVVFDPKQIKSATGNSGAFDPSNPDTLQDESPAYDTRDEPAPVSTFEEADSAASAVELSDFINEMIAKPSKFSKRKKLLWTPHNISDDAMIAWRAQDPVRLERALVAEVGEDEQALLKRLQEHRRTLGNYTTVPTTDTESRTIGRIQAIHGSGLNSDGSLPAVRAGYQNALNELSEGTSGKYMLADESPAYDAEPETLVGVAMRRLDSGEVTAIDGFDGGHGAVWDKIQGGVPGYTDYGRDTFYEDGFKTSTGRFVDRVEALEIAKARHQWNGTRRYVKEGKPPELMSEAVMEAAPSYGTEPTNEEIISLLDGDRVSEAVAPEFSPIAAVANIREAFRFASSRTFDRNRDLKLAVQARVLDAAKTAGINLSERSEAVRQYLTGMAVNDALHALEGGKVNAVGWYDITTRKALAVMSLIHPEIATDDDAKFAFTFALAVTSNGQKVDVNFRLADAVYSYYKANGTMPTTMGIGNAALAINKSLALFNRLASGMGIPVFREMMVSKMSVRDIDTRMKPYGIKVSGELKNTAVMGAAILGAKIGNGFFANLNGYFDQLTMDRWFMRSWGRWTGTLVEARPDMITLKSEELAEAITALRTNGPARRAMSDILAIKITAAPRSKAEREAWAVALAARIAKVSAKPDRRKAMNEVLVDGSDTGAAIRRVGNGLTGWVDGQKEIPDGGSERNFIRSVMGPALAKLQEQAPALTMSDLQAVLWYPEKLLYDTAKEEEQGAVAEYEEGAAPDYANAAMELARTRGISQQEIDRAIAQEVSSRPEDRTGRTERAAGSDAGNASARPAATEESTATEGLAAEPGGSYATLTAPTKNPPRLLNVEVHTHHDMNMSRLNEIPLAEQEEIVHSLVNHVGNVILKSEGVVGARVEAGQGMWFKEGILQPQASISVHLPAGVSERQALRISARISIAMKQSELYMVTPKVGGGSYAINLDFGRTLNDDEFRGIMEHLAQSRGAAPLWGGATRATGDNGNTVATIGFDKGVTREDFQREAQRLEDETHGKGFTGGKSEAYEARIASHKAPAFVRLASVPGGNPAHSRADRDAEQSFKAAAHEVADRANAQKYAPPNPPTRLVPIPAVQMVSNGRVYHARDHSTAQGKAKGAGENVMPDMSKPEGQQETTRDAYLAVHPVTGARFFVSRSEAEAILRYNADPSLQKLAETNVTDKGDPRGFLRSEELRGPALDRAIAKLPEGSTEQGDTVSETPQAGDSALYETAPAYAAATAPTEVSTPVPVPAFYSRVERGIASFPSSKGTVEQWATHILRDGKRDEVEWTGLGDLLRPALEMVDAQRKLEAVNGALKATITSHTKGIATADDVALAREMADDGKKQAKEVSDRTADARRGMLSKAEMSKTFDENKIELELVELGDESNDGLEAEDHERLDALESAWYDADMDYESHRVALREWEEDGIPENALDHLVQNHAPLGGTQSSQAARDAVDEGIRLLRARDAAERAMHTEQERQRIQRRESSRETKFAQYTMPGGENYREVLIRLKPRQPPTLVAYRKLRDARALAEYNLRQALNQPGTLLLQARLAEEVASAKAEEAAAWQKQVDAGSPEVEEQRNSHWDKQTNILAHFRIKDRVVNGERVLHVEEVQSDWGQSYRKQKQAIVESVAGEFGTIVSRMERAGALKRVCD